MVFITLQDLTSTEPTGLMGRNCIEARFCRIVYEAVTAATFAFDPLQVVTKTTASFGALVVLQTALDAGAAFGSLVLGDLLGGEQARPGA